MDDTIRIAQITDCHLPAESHTTYRGINPRANLAQLLERVSDWAPDVLLATGDLSEDASPASYLALRELLEPLKVPVLAVPGNHDDPVLLDRTFPGSPVDGVQITEHGIWQIIRLNSCVPGEPHGKLDTSTLNELSDVLGVDTGRPRLVALHHQPLEVGSPWIDKYRMLDAGGFLELVEQNDDIRAVVWGHVHQAFDCARGGMMLLGSPSSAINGLAGASKFTPDPVGAGFRWLELGSQGTIKTGVVSLGENSVEQE